MNQSYSLLAVYGSVVRLKHDDTSVHWRFFQRITALLLLTSYEYYSDCSTQLYVSGFPSKHRNYFFFIRAHFTTFWTSKSSNFAQKKPSTVVARCPKNVMFSFKSFERWKISKIFQRIWIQHEKGFKQCNFHQNMLSNNVHC